MRTLKLPIGLLALSLCISGFSAKMGTGPEIGKMVKADLSIVKDSQGVQHSLSSFKGKYVVLEWVNHGCPYVRKHYESKNMQKLQGELTGKGVVWLSVISSAKGKQGYMTAKEANQANQKKGSKATATLLDPEGKLGKMFGALTTPHMFLIGPDGKLLFKGAIDNKRSANPRDIPNAKNYLRLAFNQATSGVPISEPAPKPYGCSVKYP